MHELTRADTTSAHVAEQQLVPAPARPVAPAEEAAPSPDSPPPAAPPQSEVGPPSRTLRLARGLVGAAMGTVGLVGDGLSTAQAVNKRVIKAAEVVTAPIRKPLDALGVTELAMRPVNAVTKRVDSTVNQLEESGKSILQQSESLTLRTIDSTVDAVLDYLRDNPAVEELVTSLVQKLLPQLADDPAILDLVRKQVVKILPELMEEELVQGLIRTQGDRYIDYLNAHPDSVQNLVQGQSLNLAGEVMNEVRERTVTADTFVELVARRLFKRPGREELPEPPEIVKRRAEFVRLPGDFAEQG